MRCMGQIPGKSPRRSRVTLLAGGDHVVPAEVRARVRDFENVMGAMTIVAFGRFCISELRNLAVIGVEIGLGNLLVTLAALAHDRELESFAVGAADGMRAVAVVADRQRLA